MSYEAPFLRATYSFPAVNIGSGNSSRRVKGPSGRKGRLREVLAAVTTTFTADTTEGYVKIGTESDDDAFGTLGISTTTANNCRTLTANGTTVNADMAADTDVMVTFTAPTGGTPAGVADVHVSIDWL